MNRRRFLETLGLGAAAMSLADCGGITVSPPRPNIILFVLDELGYFELSLLGNEKLNTPSIDRMASDGIRFTQALAGAPVCAPSRSTLMTGQHTGHTTVRANSGELALRESDITIASVLKDAGYVTGGFGKWGLGDRGTSGVPEAHGFDTFFGYYHQVHAHSYFPTYLIHNSDKVPLEGNTGDFYEGEQFAHQLIFEKAVSFIRENKDRPFFCYCPWTPPHGLWGIPEDEPAWRQYENKPWTTGQQTPRDARVYAAMVSMVDRQIGQILALLEELEIDQNTIVMVSGDNGGQDYFKNGDPTGPTTEEPPFPGGFFGPNTNPATGEMFRGGKRNLYEGGLRIPMIVRWPTHVQPGQISDHVWYFPDVMPTLAEIAHAPLPPDVDGISIVPTLLGEQLAGRSQQDHEYLYWEFEGQTAVRIGRWKGVRHANGEPFELYDLLNDIEEKHDVAGLHPEVVSRMAAYAQEAHAENLKGTWINRSLRFTGHREH